MTAILAIDPGKKGGYVYQGNASQGNEPETQSGLIPLHKVPKPGGGESEEVDVITLSGLVANFEADVVYLEKNWASVDKGSWQHGGRMSGSGAFKYGRTFGRIEAAVEIMAPVLIKIAPITWKSALFGKKAVSKEEAIDYAITNYPWVDLEPGRCRSPQDGIADAVCILAYAIKQERDKIDMSKPGELF